MPIAKNLLHTAITNNQLQIAKILLENGAHPNQGSGILNTSLLCIAAKRNSLDNLAHRKNKTYFSKKFEDFPHLFNQKIISLVFLQQSHLRPPDFHSFRTRIPRYRRATT